MKLSRSFAVASAVGLMLVLAGCGDDGDDKKSTPLTAEEFKKQADEICKDDQDKIADLEPEADASEDDLDNAYKEVGKLLEEEAEKIGELTPPEDIADDVEALVESLKEGAEVVQEKGSAVEQEDPSPLADASKKAADLGLEVCGQ